MNVQESAAALRERCWANEICVQCVDRTATRGWRCGVCAPKAQVARERFSQRQRERGNCSCGAPLTGGRKWCDGCRERSRRATKRQREGWRLAGLCSGCGRKPLDGRKRCAKCAKTHRVAQRRRRAARRDQ